MTEPRHARLLLAILRRRPDDARALGRGSGEIDGVRFDAPTFVRLCRQCEVHPWVHALLDSEESDLTWDLVGDQVRAALGEARQKVRHDNLLLLARLELALDRLAAVGVVPIVLKGSDTLHRFYNGLDQRTLDDVDLLLRREDLAPALAALEAAGFETPPEPKRTRFIRSSHHLPVASPGPLPIEFELHWNIAQEPRYRIDVEGMFARAVPLEIAGRNVLRLEDHDGVAHLLIHHFSHYLGRGLKGLVDLQHIVADPGFSWDRVAEKIRNWNGVAAAGISLLHMNKMFPDLIGREAIDAMPVSRLRRALLGPLLSSHPLELYRHTNRRRIQLLLAGLMLERLASLPSWLLHRARRNSRPSDNPLDTSASGDGRRTAAAGK